jgi:delta 1-pyrroline-5-carboxylate dehydrogenase
VNTPVLVVRISPGHCRSTQHHVLPAACPAAITALPSNHVPPPPRRRVSIVAEHFVRLLQHCGMPAADVDFIHGDGKVVGGILKDAPARSSLFTGSQAVAEHLVVDLKGKVRDQGVPPDSRG